MRPAPVLCLALLAACADPPVPPSGPLAVGESRTLTLRFTPLDVRDFEKAVGRVALRRLPADLLARTWLTDLALQSPGDGTPRLLDHALRALQARDPDDPTLSPAEANLVRLLQMTPATADLRGTTLEPLLDMAPHLGFSVAEVLAETLGVDPAEPFLSAEDVGAALARHLVGSHPAARARPGPRTPENPDGRYPVPPGTLPVFLDDMLSDLRTLQRRYGPYAADGVFHPGFIGAPTEAALFGEDLALVVAANVNGVPDKGIDLETAELAAVNSIDDHPESLFDFDDPDWLRIEGDYRDPPVIDRLTFRLTEDPRFLPGGTGPEPAPRGDSPVWRAPPYVLERVVAEAAFARWGAARRERTWTRREGADPLLRVSLRDGWLTLETPGRVGDPPPPAYVWDLLLEVAQIRMHDGGLAEGDVDLALTLEDVPLGLSMEALLDRVRASVAADPSALVTLAATLFDNGWGEADLFYRRPREGDGDYLFFVAPEDIPLGDDGAPVRPYTYERPGFFADPGLKKKLSTRRPVDGDTTHEKVRVRPGDTLYCADEDGRVFRLDVGDKPGRARLALTVTRVR